MPNSQDPDSFEPYVPWQILLAGAVLLGVHMLASRWANGREKILRDARAEALVGQNEVKER